MQTTITTPFTTKELRNDYFSLISNPEVYAALKALPETTRASLAKHLAVCEYLAARARRSRPVWDRLSNPVALEEMLALPENVRASISKQIAVSEVLVASRRATT